MTDTIIEGNFPFEEIRQPNGNYFYTATQAVQAGYSENQIWSIVEGDDRSYCYGPHHHYVNLIGFVATNEAHDGSTYYSETWDD